MPAASARVEIQPVDLGAYRAGNTGVDHVHRLASGRAGPEVLVVGLTHGNELCGAHALDFLLRRAVRPSRGALTLAFANVAACATFDPAQPTASRFLDEDLNRLWSPEHLQGPRRSRELERARALLPFVEAADVLLDLHSMQLDSPALTLCGLPRQGRELALRVGFPAYAVADAGHRAGRRMRDHGAFGREGGKAALLVECGQHWLAGTVEVAIETTVRFLRAVGVVDQDFAAEVATEARPPARLIEVSEAVTIETDRFRFAGDWSGMEVLPKAGTLIGRDGERQVRTPYDDCVLIMPSRRLVRGQTAVRLGRIVA